MKLGERQKGCLRGLAEHGHWPGGWLWDTPASTNAILASLVAKGLAEVTSAPGTGTRNKWPRYRITDAGREWLDGDGN